MEQYDEEILEKKKICPDINHIVSLLSWQYRFILDLTEKTASLRDMSKSCNCPYQRHMFHQIPKVIVFHYLQLLSSELVFPISYGEIKPMMNAPCHVCTSISLTARSENKKQMSIDLLFTGNILMKPNSCGCL